jgi:hypothetical protein
MDIRIIKEPVPRDIVSEIAKEFYEDMVKGVADIKRGIIAIGGEWHSDANNVLIKDGSSQENNWGFNFYLNRPKGEEIEYVSLINIRPAQGNRDMYIEDADIRDKVRVVIAKLFN